jgi:hypothetical protein
LTNKYASTNSYIRTKYFDFLLFGTLFFVRVLLPSAKFFQFESKLGLVMHDAFYITDSLDFSTVLFDSSRKLSNENFKNLVLCVLAFSSVFYSFEAVNYNVMNSSKIPGLLIHDNLIRLLIPCLFYDIPVIVARTTIFYGFKSINLENFGFLLKNIISILIKILEYREIRLKY